MPRSSENSARAKRVSDNPLRRTNGILALVLVVFFFAHALLGALWVGGVLPSELAWVVWLGVIVIAAHVIICCLTSLRQLGDEQFPPSRRKKMHLALKWTTGGILLLAILVHVLLPDELAAQAAAFAPTIIATVVLAALAWHVCVCGKSLLKDLGAKTRWKTLFVFVILILSVVIECALLAASFGVL